MVNVDQAKKATGVLSSVTSVGDQLTDDSKVSGCFSRIVLGLATVILLV